MFENLSEKILGGLKRIRGQGKITEADVDQALKDIRLGLLEADVNFRVVKEFVEGVRQQALGQDILKSITAGQQIVKIVYDELVKLMGGENQALDLTGHAPIVILLVGLQGAGKTTTAARLAYHLKKKGRNPALISVDVYRPAAIDQLKTLAQNHSLSFFDSDPKVKPARLAQDALKKAKDQGNDILIVDTAGRLQIDEDLMVELEDLKKILAPKEILLVADSMTGQDAVNVAQGFHEKLKLTGVVLTKLDGDARGGAALSIKATTGTPIKFVGVSEKVDGLEPFHPDRLANRILDMGDIVSLVEKAQEVFDVEKAAEYEKKMRKQGFTLEDFRDQLRQIKKLGSFESILKMLPGMGNLSKQLKGMSPPDEDIKRIEAIIGSMTPQERRNYKVLNGSRRARIAKGSGTQVSDINRFIRQFEETQKMMQMFTKFKKMP